MIYEVVNISEKILIGSGIKTINENMKAIEDIGNAWNHFFINNIFSSIENKIDNKTIGLYTEYEGDYTRPYMFYTCCEVKEVSSKNNNLKKIIIPSGKYTKFLKIGDIKNAVGELWQQIWSTKLDRKYDYDYEVYSSLENSKDQLIEIYISLK